MMTRRFAMAVPFTHTRERGASERFALFHPSITTDNETP